jgi:hypothetical protein
MARDAGRAEIGVVSGYLLRLIRESIPRTQTRLAEDLGVDLGTVQGWESGRRPLANTRSGYLLHLRRQFALLGAAPSLLGMLDAGLDADRVLTAALHPAPDASRHPLAGWVQSRETTHMVAWAVRGITPPALAELSGPIRRGPTPTAPTLAACERLAFFSHLRRIVDTAHTAGERAQLLRRQALYLASYDTAPDAGDWAEQALRTMRSALALRGYTPRWIEARTSATVAARQGDPEQLYDFIDTALADDQHGELANLAYWAYWLGAMPPNQPDDAFMHDPTKAVWNPIQLFQHLVESLHEAPGSLDLYIHSIATLLEVHPWLAQAEPSTAHRYSTSATELLDGQLISPRSRRDLESVQYRLKRSN